MIYLNKINLACVNQDQLVISDSLVYLQKDPTANKFKIAAWISPTTHIIGKISRIGPTFLKELWERFKPYWMTRRIT